MVVYLTRFGVALLLAACLACVAGCETESDSTDKAYKVCGLDPNLTSKNICGGGGGGGGSTSCVVRSHPDCGGSVCLSYLSRTAVCTRSCDGDVDCMLEGIAGVCWEFAAAGDGSAAVRYCVPPDSLYEGLSGE